MLGSIMTAGNALVLKLCLCLVIVVGAYSWHKVEVQKALSEQSQKITESYNKELFKLHEAKSKSEETLKERLNENAKKNKASLDAVVSQYDTIIAGLRNRPTRSEGSNPDSEHPGSTESPTGATGKELYRDDAEFLTRYARDTETLKQYLLTCYRDHDSIKDELEKFRKEHRGF